MINNLQDGSRNAIQTMEVCAATSQELDSNWVLKMLPEALLNDCSAVLDTLQWAIKRDSSAEQTR